MKNIINYLMIIFIISMFVLYANKYKDVDNFTRNCNGQLVKAKYVPAGRTRFSRFVILEDDSKMSYRKWMHECSLVYKNKN